jgi:hypothetical protein
MEPGVGDTLREAREKRGVAIEDVAASTKIQPRQLRAIEAEDWDALPGEFYASRFIHTYAQYLGLDAGALVEDFERGVAAGRGAREPSRESAREPRVEPKPLGRATGGRRGGRRPGSRRGGTGAARAKGGLGPGVRSGGGGISLRAVGAAVILAAIVAGFIVVISGSGGGGNKGGTTTAPANQAGTGQAGAGGAANKSGGARRGHSSQAGKNAELTLTTKAEVWVCLLNAKGNALIKGQILPAGESEGPYRSPAFTVALGNGSVEMAVNGKPAKMALTSSPVGFKIGRRGGLTELSEGERPTCA